MSELPPWAELVEGTNCPLCAPRPDRSEFVFFYVMKLSVSTLYLARNQAFYGTCALVYDPRHVIRLDQLSSEEWLEYAANLRAAEAGIMSALKPDHVNVESLGNAVPHLHWHIVPRYKEDGRWGGPIWMTQQGEMPNRILEETEYETLAKKIVESIENAA